MRQRINYFMLRIFFFLNLIAGNISEITIFQDCEVSLHNFTMVTFTDKYFNKDRSVYY